MRILTAFLLISTASVAFAQQPPPGILGPEDFVRLQEDLVTCPNDPWRSIPWKTSVVEAQREAAVEGKPIFIWAMDGHPLGCT